MRPVAPVKNGSDANEEKKEREKDNDPTDFGIDAAKHVQHPRPQRNVNGVEKNHHHRVRMGRGIHP